MRAGSPSGASRLAESPWKSGSSYPHRQNTVYVDYRIVPGDDAGGGGPSAVAARHSDPSGPLIHFRPHDAPVNSPHPGPYRFTASADRYEISCGREIPPLRITLAGRAPAFTLDAVETMPIAYPLEAQRGYESTGDLWSPGFFRVELTPEEPATLIASVESWEIMLALTPAEAQRAERVRRGRLVNEARREARSRHGPDALRGDASQVHGADLVLAADQFLITPEGRVEDAARAHAAGEEVRTIIAGYHWFTDWGRDTMISLEVDARLGSLRGSRLHPPHAIAHYILVTA